jgi:hypothetical protein
MTITLDDRPEIPLHPLDLTTEPINNNRAQYCIGMIQASQTLQDPSSGIGDMILGVPFLRNTYTVMGYDTPFPNGSFPLPSAPGPSPSADSSEADIEIHPALGLLALTNATVALQEFQTVRVLNQPLEPSGRNGTSTGGLGGAPVTVGPKRLSVGIIVLIVLLGFFALCCALFGVRWVVMRKRFEGAEEVEGGGGGGEKVGGGAKVELGGVDSEGSLVDGGIVMKKRGSYDDEESVVEGGVVAVRPRNRTGGSSRVESDYTASSGRTRVGNDDFGEFGYGVGGGGAGGSKAELKESIGTGSRWSLVADDSTNFPLVRRSIRVSQGSGGKVPQSPLHERNPSGVVPILSSSDSTQQQQQPHDADGVSSPSEDADQLGLRVEDSGASGSSMAGVGTARGRLSQFESLAVPFPRESFLSGSTVGEEEPSYPPLEGVNEEGREGGEMQEQRQEEQQEPPPQPVTPDTPIPSGAGNPVYPPRPTSTAILDDFDPYAAP